MNMNEQTVVKTIEIFLEKVNRANVFSEEIDIIDSHELIEIGENSDVWATIQFSEYLWELRFVAGITKWIVTRLFDFGEGKVGNRDLGRERISGNLEHSVIDNAIREMLGDMLLFQIKLL